MGVAQLKFPVLALPQGLTHLPTYLLPYLEQFHRIIIWLGDGQRAKQAGIQFANKLNFKRCYLMLKPLNFPSDTTFRPLTLQSEGYNLEELMGYAELLSHEKIITFIQIRSEVWYELYNANQIAGLRWTRFPELSNILKGYRRGELSIYTGQTGSGKTTLLSELSLDLCVQGVATLWGSFEINIVRLAKTMLKQFSKLNLERCTDKYQDWADKFELLPMYFMNYFGANKFSDLIEAMRYATYVYDVEHIVIDNLQFMIDLDSYWDRFRVQDKIVAGLRKFATEENVHISLVVHPRKERDDTMLDKSSVYGTAKAIQEADNILIIHSIPGDAKYLEVSKNRFDGTQGEVKLNFNPSNSCCSN